ncbi:MAG: outer rane adhesin-like protein, partial [Bradyrhizobium sp.]|nr:outer rane adhesin-like protein [Bradyrhizobium sp.]
EINNLAINNMLAQGGGGAGLGGDGGGVGFLEVNNGGGGGGVGGAAGSILTGVGAKARFPSLLARSMSMSQVSCASGAVSQLVFIDRGVEDHHTLLAGLAAGARALVLDPSREALVQIVEVLEACGPVEAVHIVAHGSPGELHFISGTLSHKNLPEHASALARIGCALQAGGDILLYGCDVARGEAGRSFIEKLAEITGADVAAASHPVGARGGSFDLDLRIGTIATVTPFAPRSLAAFSGLLNGGDGGGVRTLTYGGSGGTGNAGQQGGDGGYSVAGGGGGGGASGTTTGGGGGAGGHNSGGSGGSGGSGAGAAGSNGTDGTLSSSNANGGGGGGGGGGVAGNGNTGILGGSFTGGAGGDGGRGGNGAQTAGGGGGGGGAGGDGAVVTSSVLNAFTLLGGDGGDSGNGGVAAGQFLINGEGGAGGSGGIGLRVVGSGFSVTNSGSITGGNGGSGGGGFGGDGLVGESLNVVNSGTISGGVDPVNARANAITFTGGTNSIRFDHGGTSGLVGDISVTGSVNLLSLTASTLIDNSITGSGSVSKGGSNLITLSGDNSYSGGTSLNSGTLAVGGFSALGSGTLAMANGTTLQAATALTLGNAVTITGTATIDANGKGTTLNGAVSGIGTLNVTNSSGTAANVTLGNAGNAFTLGSVSLPGGDFTLVGSGSGGTLTVSGPVSATNISLTAGNNLSIAGTLTASGLTLNAAGVTTLGVSLTGIGSLETDAAGTTALNGGSVTTTAKQIYNDAVTLGRNATLTDTGAGIAFMSTVNGSFSLTTNVGWVTVFNGAVGGTTALTSLSIDGGLQTQLNGGSVRTTGAQSYHDYVVLGAATTLTSTGSGAITFEDDVKNGGFDLHVITAGAGTFDGEIFGAGKFIQGGSGTTTLSAINTYTGTTTINAGTLLVDGSITSSITSVNNGGTLGGHGTTGAVNVASGGALSPGAGAGLLTTGDLSLSSGAHFRAEIGGAAAGSSYDQVHVNGTVSLGGATLNASVINGFVPASGSFKIIDNDGNDQVTGTFAGLAEGSSFFAGAVRYAISYHGGDGNDVVLTVIPPNNPPVAVDDDDTATEDTAPNPVTGNVLANDSDPDGNALTVTSAGTFNLGHGTLVVHADGSYSYTLDNSNPAVDALNNGQTLVDSFTYGISDGQGGTRSAMLAITIHGRTDNFPPDVAGAVTLAAIAEDSGVRLITQAQLLGNVTDVDGPSLTATDLTIATGSGTLADNNDGTWSYTPALNDDTSVSFSYQVTDSFTSVADSATLDITPVNDAPVAGAVTLAAIAEDSGARLITQAQILCNFTDVDGPSLTATNLAIATGAGALVDNNDGSWSYTPALNDDAAVSFSFQVT